MNADEARRVSSLVSEERSAAQRVAATLRLVNAYPRCREAIRRTANQGGSRTPCDVMEDRAVEALRDDGFGVTFRRAFDGDGEYEPSEADYLVTWSTMQSSTK